MHKQALMRHTGDQSRPGITPHNSLPTVRLLGRS
jgi:hypothetical protein